MRDYNKLIVLSREKKELSTDEILRMSGNSENMSHEQVCLDIESIKTVRNMSEELYDVLNGW